jgi:hypothetical protein
VIPHAAAAEVAVPVRVAARRRHERVEQHLRRRRVRNERRSIIALRALLRAVFGPRGCDEVECRDARGRRDVLRQRRARERKRHAVEQAAAARGRVGPIRRERGGRQAARAVALARHVQRRHEGSSAHPSGHVIHGQRPRRQPQPQRFRSRRHCGRARVTVTAAAAAAALRPDGERHGEAAGAQRGGGGGAGGDARHRSARPVALRDHVPIPAWQGRRS